MADDEATRSRRKRRHAAGDHSDCNPVRCRARRAEPNAPGRTDPGLPDDTGDAPSAAQRLVGFLATQNLQPSDPADVIACLALILATRLDRGEVDAVRASHEIAHMVSDIAQRAPEGASSLDEVRAQYWVRRMSDYAGELRAAAGTGPELPWD